MPASRFLKIVQEMGQNSSAVSTCQFLLPGTTLYIAFHDGGRDGPNTAYENETETRQELLALAAPFFISILARLVTCDLFQDVAQKYPRWMENIITRNTVQSNTQYMEFMTLSHTWSDNQWDAPAFNLFCQKLNRELGSLLTACHIIPAPLAELKLVVQEVCEENAHNVSDIGYKFGHMRIFSLVAHFLTLVPLSLQKKSFP